MRQTKWLAGLVAALLALALLGAAGAELTPIREPASGQGIATGTMVRADTMERYEALAADRPSIAALRTDAALNVLGDGGAVLDSFEGALEKLGRGMALAFEVADLATADALMAAAPRSAGPLLMISSDAEVLRHVMDQRSAFLLVLDRANLAAPSPDAAKEALSALRAEVVGCGAINVLLGAEWAQPEWVAFLQRGLTSVWLEAEPGADIAALARLVTAGANTIACQDMKAVEACMALLGENAVTRRVFLSGHRGGMNLAPENTFFAFDAGIEAGCDILELDVAMTRDGEVIAMHDRDLFRTTGGTGAVAQRTWEQIGALYANREWPDDPRFAQARVPTLEEILARYQGTGISLMIEIKGSEMELHDRIAELVKAYGMEDDCTVISNNYVSVALMKKAAPWLGRGFLANNMFDSAADPGGALGEALGYAAKYSTHVFPDGTGQSGEEYVRAMAKLGLGTIAFAWDAKKFDAAMCAGMYAVCTNDPDWASGYAHTIKPLEPALSLSIGEALSPLVNVTTYGQGAFDAEAAGVILLSGEGCISASGGAITGVAPGEAILLLEYAQETALGSVYRLYTQPVIVTVK